MMLGDSTAAGSQHHGSQATYKTRARDEYRSKQKGAKADVEREYERERKSLIRQILP